MDILNGVHNDCFYGQGKRPVNMLTNQIKSKK